MTKTTFFTNEAVSLEKSVELTCSPIETKPDDIDVVYEIDRCVHWIQSNGFKKVCLQFPDYLLPDSSEVILRLQSILNQTIYLLGDTAYESCCIDYIAAAHILADAIINFGPVCFSKSSANIPFIHIYEKCPLNLDELKKRFEAKFTDDQRITVLIDTIYLHMFDQIKNVFQDMKHVSLERIDEITDISKGLTLFLLGSNERKLLNIALNYKPQTLCYYHNEIKIFESISKTLKRRNYVIEKIKDSETIGIVIGTLGVKNYLKIIDRMKALISQSGKKYYLLSVGKPTIAKLANFPELDVYVVVTCSMSEIYENRDFYKPIASPFDVEAALNLDPERHQDFTFDYNTFVDKSDIITSSSEPSGDVSLLTNKIRLPTVSDSNSTNDDETQSVAVKNNDTVALNNFGAGYLAQKTWQGLEQNLGKTDVQLAKEGRSGIPSQYKNEQL